MTRAGRWMGLAGAAAAAVLGMVTGDMALAASRQVVSYDVRLDMLSPPDMACRAEGGGSHRPGHDIFGHTRVTVHGTYDDIRIRCRRPDGPEAVFAARPDPRDPLAVAVDAILVFRTDRATPLMLVEASGQGLPVPVRGNVAVMPAPRAATD